MTAIDVWAQQPNPHFLAQPFFDSLKKWTGMSAEDLPLSLLLDAMDASSVSQALLAAWYAPQGPLITNEEVRDVVARANSRRYAV